MYFLSFSVLQISFLPFSIVALYELPIGNIRYLLSSG